MMLKFAIVGYDHVHVLKYLPTIAHHPEASLVAIAAIERKMSLINRFAERPYQKRSPLFFISLK